MQRSLLCFPRTPLCPHMLDTCLCDCRAACSLKHAHQNVDQVSCSCERQDLIPVVHGVAVGRRAWFDEHHCTQGCHSGDSNGDCGAIDCKGGGRRNDGTVGKGQEGWGVDLHTVLTVANGCNRKRCLVRGGEAPEQWTKQWFSTALLIATLAGRLEPRGYHRHSLEGIVLHNAFGTYFCHMTRSSRASFTSATSFNTCHAGSPAGQHQDI
jgi:hypothetical protein